MTSSFFPPQRTLMGPGPSDVSPRVLGALARPTIGHLDPLFVQLMDEIPGTVVGRVAADNAVSIGLSESIGYETVGVIRQAGRKFGRLIDVCIMQIMLNDAEDRT